METRVPQDVRNPDLLAKYILTKVSESEVTPKTGGHEGNSLITLRYFPAPGRQASGRRPAAGLACFILCAGFSCIWDFQHLGFAAAQPCTWLVSRGLGSVFLPTCQKALCPQTQEERNLTTTNSVFLTRLQMKLQARLESCKARPSLRWALLAKNC